MNREEAIASLMWCYAPGDPRARFGGGTWEIDPEASYEDRERYGRDWKSTVCVGAPAEQYTDEELIAIAEFAARSTARYDNMFGRRRGMNYIMIEKRHFSGQHAPPEWFRARASWSQGPMYSNTLVEALAVWPEFGGQLLGRETGDF